MIKLLKFGSIPVAIFLAAMLILAVAHKPAKPKAGGQLKTEEQSALKSIMPSADSFSEKTLDGIEYFEALRCNTVVGYCVRVAADGYSGKIRMIAGIDPNGIIYGVRVIEQNETPGFGSRITEVRPGDKDPWFLRQFSGKDARKVAIKKDIDAITGATISSKAITDAINKTINSFMSSLAAHKLKLGEKQDVCKQ